MDGLNPMTAYENLSEFMETGGWGSKLHYGGHIRYVDPHYRAIYVLLGFARQHREAC